MNEKRIMEEIEILKQEAPHYHRLMDYYKGYHDILQRRMSDSTKPNNRIVNNHAKLIVDTIAAYFIGQPVQYFTPAEGDASHEEFVRRWSQITEYNDDDDHNNDVATNMGVYGMTHEFLFVGEHHVTGEPIPRYVEVSPAQARIVYDDQIIPDIVGAIRYYSSGKDEQDSPIYYVDVYDDSTIKTYRVRDGMLELKEEFEHFFRDVPVVPFWNNSKKLSDFGDIIGLIDAYNLLASDSVNDQEAFVDAYLALTGFSGSNSDDIGLMKENRVLLLEQGDGAQWITKNINDTAEENRKTRIQSDIYRMASIPDLSDENFGSQLSGVAIAFKLWGLEQIAVMKERKFQKGLQRRIELICNFWRTQGFDYDYTDVDIRFTRNMPMNNVEMIELALKAGAHVSQETILSWLPGVDAKDEMERIEGEEEDIRLRSPLMDAPEDGDE